MNKLNKWISFTLIVKVLFSPLIAANAISLLENLTKAYPRKMRNATTS